MLENDVKEILFKKLNVLDIKCLRSISNIIVLIRKLCDHVCFQLTQLEFLRQKPTFPEFQATSSGKKEVNNLKVCQYNISIMLTYFKH